MADLSPAAQEILAAYENSPFEYDTGHLTACAAVLRAATDQVKHEFPLCCPVTEWDSGHDAGIRRALNKFLALAAELEGATSAEANEVL